DYPCVHHLLSGRRALASETSPSTVRRLLPEPQRQRLHLPVASSRRRLRRAAKGPQAQGRITRGQAPLAAIAHRDSTAGPSVAVKEARRWGASRSRAAGGQL